VTDKEIALVENIRTDEINPYEPINSDEKSESDNEESHSSGSNKSDNNDQTTYESEYKLVKKSKQTIEVVIFKRKSFIYILFAADRRLTIYKLIY